MKGKCTILKGFILFLGFSAYSQPTSKDLRFSAGYSLTYVDMTYFNTQANNNSLYLDGAEITTTNKIYLGLDYEFIKSLRIGGQVNYQFTNLEGFDSFEISPPDFPDNITTFYGKHKYQLESFGFGLTGKYVLSDEINLFSKFSKNRLKLELMAEVGYARTRVTDVILTDLDSSGEITESSGFFDRVYKSSADLYGLVGCNILYKISNKSVFSEVGFTIGYQFYETDFLENELGEIILANTPGQTLRVDYSGIQVGLFLTVGK